MSDILEQLEALLPELPSAVERQRLGQQLDVSAEKLRNGLQEAERLKALLDLTTLLGLDGHDHQDDVDEAREEAGAVGAALLATEDAAQLKQATDRYERDFLPALKRLHRNLIQRWDVVSTRDFRPLIQVGEMLQRLDQGSNLGADLASCGRDATSYKPGASASEFLNKVSDLLTRREQLQERRRTNYGDGAIAAFVNALAENGASLEMVTPEVRRWLDEHGASKWLRVSV